ncbi:hypothetical protein HHI36_007988 [Cryptolaemus montrouzieri]|uniref:Uncharacterized protein n=1 Tax=Cryptolaemus montrouzieri TaxID=559131 RepID=A0ABD2MS26_9CUCU
MVHIQVCITISDEVFENLKENVGQWSCESCSSSVVDDDPTMISGLNDVMKKLSKMERKNNLLLDWLDKVTEENQLLKSELGDIKNQVETLSGRLESNTEEVLAEMKDREYRARNIIVYNLDESKHADLDERIKHDKNEVVDGGTC